ncbi:MULTISPECIES: FtsW/RodA/SpoVE family cell cycle protein [Janibacter]|uniref:Cell division protein n=1 Tax=Janibacter melonis TaxID=262209 RepID=A0A176QHC4_9MICO|nr:FtsW/RodA/SpoVE family cell cycle protein [Janibacter melonis]MCB5991213.1 FtsW/RodA/SpoVE family cell cycle protein [Janibacter melonis]MCM3555622.1 FtsW/RodA/SpoVE family cell cycle protein [Janibacter melonis]OAB89090.1 cell division protein [Janibacter melonis]QFQ31811.2 FtsW/RodA/SpoVE family cell cycle protein [Janibacter melonis]
MKTITTIAPKRGRNVELLLVALAIGVVVLAYINVEVAANGSVPPDLLAHTGMLAAIALVFHVVLRWRASYADPLVLPILTLLNGIGLVMIHRLDLAAGRDFSEGYALKQLQWTALGVALALTVLVALRDHRVLRRYTYTAGLLGLVLLLLPLLPIIGHDVYGANIWIKIGPFTFQPAEVAKICFAVFFAGYLVQTRDVLALAGRKVLGLTLPRGRDLGPILVAWVASVLVLVLETDLGTSLLLFGLFVSMLYVATERVSWIAIGLSLAAFGAFVAYRLFPHLQTRVLCWVDPFSEEGTRQCGQLVSGLMGLSAGGLLGTGLGRGRPWSTPLPETDFIFNSLGEELGLVGIMAIIALYAILVERGLRSAIGLRDGFGKLLATGLAFTVALQVFVVVGGVTRVIPLTGLTLPFVAYGGSSLLANWTLAAILLRISDHARRPEPELDPASMDAPTEVVSTR